MDELNRDLLIQYTLQVFLIIFIMKAEKVLVILDSVMLNPFVFSKYSETANNLIVPY